MNKTVIENIKAREILDSRGYPTVEVSVRLSDNTAVAVGVPSGASTGRYEAYELRDGNMSRYFGKGVLQAVSNVNEVIAKALRGFDPFCQSALDEVLIRLDGTDNKCRLGANAILAVSLANALAAAKSKGLSLYEYLLGENKHALPTPMLNILNGGVHAANNVDIQEFMIVPLGNIPFKEKLRKSAEVYHALKTVLSDSGIQTVGVGDEGGYAPNLKNDRQAIELILKAIEKAKYTPSKDFALALDAASSEWYDSESGMYRLPKSGACMSSDELLSIWRDYVNAYPIISIEDGMSEDDSQGWKKMTETFDNRIMLVGDDLFVTNPERIKRGIENRLANALLVKANQVGTLTETIAAVKTAQNAGYKTILSHRSGETNDSYIADIAVALGAEYIKAGAPSRGERVAKYNRLLEIEECCRQTDKSVV